MQHGFPLDPREILGVSTGASLEEIREAYRAKARRHHPDHGGEEWAFRVVKRSYEILSTERLAGRVTTEARPPRPAPHPRAASTHRPPDDDARRPQWVTVGIDDALDDPLRMVDVEVFQLRYAIADLMEALSRSPDERLLSCTLNFSWPSKRVEAETETNAAASEILPILERVFAPLPRKTRAIASYARAEDGRFSSWLSFADVTRAEEALKVAHRAFLDEGLGFYQWTRELAVPRDGS